jgi:acyl-CoA synthetase (AMP-forming)/AMP-acid ligase II/thioesterase domain-containing protein
MAPPSTEYDLGDGRGLGDFDGRATSTPHAIALIEPGRESLTFDGVRTRIRRVAGAVSCAGITRQDVVALLLPDGARLVTSFLGVASVATCAIINPALRKAEIESALADLQARAVIVDSTFSSLVEDAARRREMALFDVDSCVAGPQLARWDAAPGHEVALLLHTSATTGKARIVPLTHFNLLAMAANTRAMLNLTSGDRFLSMMPLFHLQGLLSSLAQMLAGGAVIATPGFDARLFLSWLEAYGPTWYTAGPALHHAILPLVESRPNVLVRSPLRFVRSIGAPLQPALLQRLERTLHAPVLEGYGMTEAGAITSNAPPPHPRKRGSVGRSTGSEIGIMGENGQLLPPACEGEIVVRGPAVMQSYRNNPEANRSAFRGGWFRTGDLGSLDTEGFLFVTGRIKEMINRGGNKILPAEIEDALMAHPAVAEAVVFGIAHPTLGEDVMAAVVLRPGFSANDSELRSFAAKKIADYKLPRRTILLDAIPKGATGKPARIALAEQFNAEMDGVPERSPATSEVEKKLAGIWQKILNVESVGTRDDFFQLGGDSLALTLMLTEVGIEFGSDDSEECLSSPNIETLARILMRSPGVRSETSPFIALQPKGSRIPFFCIPGAEENPYCFLHLAKELGLDQPFFVVRDPRPLQDRGLYTLEEHAARFRDVILSMRPEGPCLLGGYCYGGILAFEIARQLMAANRDVPLLVLFEVPTPGYPKIARHWKNILRQSATLFSRLLRGGNGTVWQQARSQLGVWRTLVGRKLQATTRRVLVSTHMQAVIQSIEPVEVRNERAARAYIPFALKCNVVHFLAADKFQSPPILHDPRLGWGDVAGDGLSVHKVHGVADAIFKPPNVSELGSQLRSLLDRENARAGTLEMV